MQTAHSDSSISRVKKFALRFRGAYYRVFGRPFKAGETSKAHARRTRENFFEKYCQGRGLDVGCGGDPIVKDVFRWDREYGDAQFLNGIQNETFDYVYSSHVLEHMDCPSTALKNWWRVLKPDGHLIFYVPDRDVYEKKLVLPSKWNPDHKHFFLRDRDEPPHTKGIIPLVRKSLPDARIIYVKNCRDGHTITDPDTHSDGEYSIEAVLQKP